MTKKFSQGFALLVGVGGDLSNTAIDAQGMADILVDESRCAYPQSQVKLLTQTTANRQTILDALDELAGSTNPESTLIFYFSGHGYRVSHPAVGDTFWLMANGYDVNNLTTTAIRGSELNARLAAIPAQKLLILLDCCHAGGVGEEKAPDLAFAKSPLPEDALNLLSQGSGRILIASSKEDEKSFAGKPYSAFTLALIESFSGTGAAQMDGYVRVTDLALHTRQVVPGRTQGRQHPILHFEHADNFVVAYYAGGDTQPKGLPFTQEPEIEPEPGAWSIQSQTNITASGPVFTGNVSGQVAIGDHNVMTQVNAQSYQDRSVHIDAPVMGSQIITGDDDTVTINQPGYQAEMIEIVHEMQALLLRSGLLPEEQEEVRQDLKKVEEQLLSPHVNKGIILKRLESTSGFLSTSDSINASDLVDLSEVLLRLAKALPL
jgi:hypothetical protein